MERKRLITIIIVAIVIVGVFGWYYLFGMQNVQPTQLAKVNIDLKDYTTPLIWNLTTASGVTQEFSHNITNSENNATSIGFNFTIWHLEGPQWVEQYNGTRWLVNNATAVPTIIVEDNVTAVSGTAFANKSSSGESATYYYSLVFSDKMIYLNLNYLGNNPTVDGQTVFAYAAFDVNGNGTLNPSDKAFNFTSNPSLPTKNHLKIYTPATSSSWNKPANYSWNGNVSSNDVPITVLCSDNRTNITFAFPFSCIGATRGGYLGFILQAFSHNWVFSSANVTTPDSRMTVSSLSLPSVTSFPMEPHTTLTFYTKAVFTPAASGDYSIVFEFQAMVQNPS
jgi:hypothetical protein